jgi:hypothetical protein
MGNDLIDNLLGGSNSSSRSSGQSTSDIMGGSGGGAGGRVLNVKHKPNQGWSVEGRTAGFGMYDTKSDAVSKARSVYNRKSEYVGVRVHTKNGALQTGKSFGDY